MCWSKYFHHNCPVLDGQYTNKSCVRSCSPILTWQKASLEAFKMTSYEVQSAQCDSPVRCVAWQLVCLPFLWRTSFLYLGLWCLCRNKDEETSPLASLFQPDGKRWSWHLKKQTCKGPSLAGTVAYFYTRAGEKKRNKKSVLCFFCLSHFSLKVWWNICLRKSGHKGQWHLCKVSDNTRRQVCVPPSESSPYERHSLCTGQNPYRIKLSSSSQGVLKVSLNRGL